MNLEVQSDSSNISNDVHFELINSKLDTLLQVVMLTEKKPSYQMQHLLQLNDKEDEMVLYSKQINLELQNIVNEQEAQLKAYRSQHFMKSIQCQQMLIEQREAFYNQNAKLNDTIKYLAKENLNIRQQYNELTKNNYSLIEFIKQLTQSYQSQDIQQQLQSLGIPIQQEISGQMTSQEEAIEVKQQKKIISLERFLVQVLSSYKNNTEREELLNVKNHLEQKLSEMAELNEQFQQMKKDNQIYIKRLKQANLFEDLNAKNPKRKGQFSDNFPLQREATRQTRGKRINFKEIIKEFDDDIEDSFLSDEDGDDCDLSLSSINSSEQQTKNFRNQKNYKQNNNNNKNNSRKEQDNNVDSDNYDSDDSQDIKKKQKSQSQNKSQKRKNTQIEDSDEYSEDEEATFDNEKGKRKSDQKNKRQIHKDEDRERKRKRIVDDKLSDEESDFEDSLDSELKSEEQYSEDEDSDYGKKRKQQKANSKPDLQAAQNKQKKVIPEKKKVVSQNKKPVNKKQLKKKNLESQDRLFNQLDMMLDM